MTSGIVFLHYINLYKYNILHQREEGTISLEYGVGGKNILGLPPMGFIIRIIFVIHRFNKHNQVTYFRFLPTYLLAKLGEFLSR